MVRESAEFAARAQASALRRLAAAITRDVETDR